MNDTDPKVQAELRKRLRATDPTRRLRMMSGMFATARVLAGSAPTGGADGPKATLFKRLYRTDFSSRDMARIVEHLNKVDEDR